MLLMGTAGGGKLLPLAGAPAAPPEAMAGAISFRPKFSKLLETLLMFSGAALALALKKNRSHHILVNALDWHSNACIALQNWGNNIQDLNITKCNL